MIVKDASYSFGISYSMMPGKYMVCRDNNIGIIGRLRVVYTDGVNNLHIIYHALLNIRLSFEDMNRDSESFVGLLMSMIEDGISGVTVLAANSLS
ncbi:MAG TPA: hypothetical protein VN371_07820 [Chlorobaculum sp.]|nr:hypothetical protein [Chlorobaculum sp.]